MVGTIVAGIWWGLLIDRPMIMIQKIEKDIASLYKQQQTLHQIGQTLQQLDAAPPMTAPNPQQHVAQAQSIAKTLQLDTALTFTQDASNQLTITINKEGAPPTALFTWINRMASEAGSRTVAMNIRMESSQLVGTLKQSQTPNE
jgi:type II secretory pathway component PulM